MLSAFRAQPIYELKPRDKSKIESVSAYGDRLSVGSNTGSLRIYRVNDTSDELSTQTSEADDNAPSKTRAVDLLREEEKFSRRPILQLAIIKEANILVSSSDNYVSIHDLQTYALQERLEKTRGATAFAVMSHVVKDEESGIPSSVSRLAVAVKRKIVLWNWQDMELMPETQEVASPASVKSSTWATGTRVVVGMDPGFSIVDVDTQEITDINKPGQAGDAAGQAGVRFGAVNASGMGYMGMGSWVPKPMATKLAEGQSSLAKDVNTLFVDADGKALEKRQIPWHTAPEAVGYSYPYLLALQQTAKGALDVRNPDTLSLLQTINLPGASFLHVPQPNISLAHAGKGFLVASERCIWRMGASGYEAQIDELVSKARYDEAISLLNMLEDTLLKDKEGRIREIMMLKAQGLFEQQKYRPALDLFTDASAPPERVIALYPKSIAGEISSIESAEASEAEAPADEQQEDNGEGQAKGEEDAKETPSGPQKSVLGKVMGGQKRDSDAGSIRSLKTDTDNLSIRGKPGKPAVKPLEGSDLKAAVSASCSFLAQSRVQIQKYINPDGTLKDAAKSGDDSASTTPPFAKLIKSPDVTSDINWQTELLSVGKSVDTTLFRAYMHALPSLAGPLFRLDNFCDPHVVEEKLYESGRYTDLIDFSHGKKSHREALELLEKFGRNEAAEEVMPALRGPGRTVGYLQQSPPELIDIILEFAEWPIRTHPDSGMEVFLADTENAENSPRDRVLDFSTPLDQELAVRYLEHIINESNDTTPDYHQRSVDLYLSRLRDDTSPDHAAQRARLESFLRNSTHYNKAKTFRQLPSDKPDFYEARAIVSAAMGNHKQALSIYVFQIRDSAKAEEYCNRLYLSSQQQPEQEKATKPPLSRTTSERDRPSVPIDPESAAHPNIYTTLSGLYLRPPPGEQVQWPPALDSLSKHGARLPASSTLDLMPNDLAIKESERYFRGRMRNANSVLNEERIVRGLEGVRKVAVEMELLLGRDVDVGSGGVGAGTGTKGGRARRVVIREDDHCRVCHKRFGASAVRVYPDNEVVHYGCVGRSGVKRQQGSDFGGLKRVPWA